MASFRKGLELGADFVECDVHLSKDGRCVVLHDASVERTTDGRGLVRKLSFAELKKLDAGSWFSEKFRGEKIPLLDELLAWARRRKTRLGKPLGVVVEIKNDPVRYRGIERKVLESVRKSKMEGRVVIISFDHAAVRRFKRLKPSIPAGILYSEPLPRGAERAVRFKADALMPRRTLVTRGLVEQARENGLKVATWTVNETGEMRRILGCGVHAVTTNFPDRLKPLLGGKS